MTDVAALGAVTQRMIHEYQREHRLGDWRCTYAYAGIMATEGLDHHRIAVAVYRATWGAYAGRGLDRDVYRDVLTRRNTPQNAAGVIAYKTIRRDFITVLGALLRN